MIDPFEVALQLKECLCSNLESTIGGKVCRCTIYPSDIPTADICEKSLLGNGEAKVHIGRIFDSKNFPNEEFELRCEGSYTVVEVVQTVWRCGPTVGDNGRLPSIEAFELATMTLLDDAKAMRCAIKCCIDSRLIQVGSWEILSLQGGCMGGQLRSLVGIDQDQCTWGSI